MLDANPGGKVFREEMPFPPEEAKTPEIPVPPEKPGKRKRKR